MGPATNTVYTVESFTVAGAERLLRLLLGRPAEVDPPVVPAPHLPQRGHALSTPAGAAAGVRHDLAVHVEPDAGGGVRTRTELAGTLLGEQVAGLPGALGSCWTLLDSPTGHELLAVLGNGLWRALFDDHTGARLVELIDHSPFGSVVDVVVYLAEDLVGLPVELLRLPDGRLAATVGGVRLTRRLAGVDREPAPPLPGPLKILAAVAAPTETLMGNAAVDVEEQMQALLDAVGEADLSEQAQVRILEVASLSEITKALGDDQYHVLHLFGHGSPNGIELEDEDGNALFADTEQLLRALRGGEHLLPVVVLSSCSGAAGGTTGLAAELVRHGADRVVAMHTTVTDTYASALGTRFYRALTADQRCTVAQALATARRHVEQDQQEQQGDDKTPRRVETSVATLLAAGPDRPLRDPAVADVPLKRATRAPSGRGVRELPLGDLIGRRAPLRTAIAALRGTRADRERVGAWSGAALTGIRAMRKVVCAAQWRERRVCVRRALMTVC